MMNKHAVLAELIFILVYLYKMKIRQESTEIGLLNLRVAAAGAFRLGTVPAGFT